MNPTEAEWGDVLLWSGVSAVVLLVALGAFCAYHFPRNDHEEEADEGFTGGGSRD